MKIYLIYLKEEICRALEEVVRAVLECKNCDKSVLGVIENMCPDVRYGRKVQVGVFEGIYDIRQVEPGEDVEINRATGVIVCT